MFAQCFWLSLPIQVMKKIIFLVIILFAAIITMAYLYFHRLNTERISSDSGLHAAIISSPVVFSFQNDKSVLDILKGQSLFSEIVGQANFTQMISLKEHLLSIPSINALIDQQTIYISLIPAGSKKIDLLYTTQFSQEGDAAQLLSAIKSANIKLMDDRGISKIELTDSSVFYFAIKEKVLLLSENPNPVREVLTSKFEKNNKFADFIKSSSKLSKTSLAELYINFAELPRLLESAIAGKLSGELSPLNDQNAFASFVYNFSNDKILLTGTSIVNDAGNYYQLFTNSAAQKVNITNLLPDNTANYSIFTIADYADWKLKLNKWFESQKTEKVVQNTIERARKQYHLDLDQVFPRYFGNQFITFQLSTAERVGAINLSNGDKTHQLLLELSDEHSDEIRLLKEDNLLYAYFGEPFKKFKKPFYTIIDNYMVFANHASTLQSFLNSYRNNRLLINSQEYIDTINLLPNTVCIEFFLNFKQSRNIFRKNVYLPYYRHLISEDGLKEYSSFTYQLYGENGKFQSNLLINKWHEPNSDSVAVDVDSLANRP